MLTIESLAELAAVQQPPCLSLYQTTHLRRPENQQDPIRFRNLVKELEISLRQRYSDIETGSFWSDLNPSVTIMPSGNTPGRDWRCWAGPRHSEYSVSSVRYANWPKVADSFHRKPLRHSLQLVDRYQVLGLSMDKIDLFEGTRDSLDKIDPAPAVPRTMTETLGSELTDSHQKVASDAGVGQGSSPLPHADGGRREEVQIDAERFFRAVDRAVLEHHSRPTGLPLILAALPEHHHLFHQVSRNPFLAAEGLTTHPDALPIGEVRERAWQLVEPQYQARLAKLADEFEKAKSNGLGSDDLAEVAHAAATGRVATLSIESDRQIAGRPDISTGGIELSDLGIPTLMTFSTTSANWCGNGRPGPCHSGGANVDDDRTRGHLPLLKRITCSKEMV